jgi:hypothetical protein
MNIRLDIFSNLLSLAGKRYDLILATQSSGGANVLNGLKKAVGYVNTEMINSAFSVIVGDKQDLDSFM